MDRHSKFIIICLILASILLSASSGFLLTGAIMDNRVIIKQNKKQLDKHFSQSINDYYTISNRIKNLEESMK